MSTSSTSDAGDERPEFMVRLGLIPPYTVDDVKQAYLEKARSLHPDHGGSTADFVAIQDAFEQATQYAKFRESRLHWLSSQVERYANQERVVEELERRGARVVIEPVDWLTRSFGVDFAQVADKLVGVEADGAAANDELIEYLAVEHGALTDLRRLTLAEGTLSETAVMRIGALRNLRELDLHGTPVTRRGLAAVEYLPELRRLNLRGTGVGWLARWRLGRKLRQVEVVG
jgi:hypothetical protein